MTNEEIFTAILYIMSLYFFSYAFGVIGAIVLSWLDKDA